MNEKTLRTAILSGRVDKGATVTRGRIRINDQAAVMETFRANRNAAQDRRPGEHAASLVAVEMRLKEARAKKVEQEAEARAGLVVLRADVRRAEYEVGKTVRESMENIPDRVCGQLAVETNPAVVRAVLAEEIRRALELLAGSLEAAAAS